MFNDKFFTKQAFRFFIEFLFVVEIGASFRGGVYLGGFLKYEAPMKTLILGFGMLTVFISGCASKSQAKTDRRMVETMLSDLQKIEKESLTPVVANSGTQGDNR